MFPKIVIKTLFICIVSTMFRLFQNIVQNIVGQFFVKTSPNHRIGKHRIVKNIASLRKVSIAHPSPKRLQVAGKSRSNGGSEWNTCGETTLSASLVRKMHSVVWKWPQSGQIGPRPPILVIRGSRGPIWLAKVEQMVDHRGTHVGGLP